jgi:L-malate glycosyltransferase
LIRILHCHSTFAAGGKEARAVRLMNAFGNDARHTILSAVPGALAARAMIDEGIAVSFPENAPSLQGKPGVRRYREIADYLTGFDLVLTYNWGAMDVVMTRRIFGRKLPPLIHHEDGFNADEAVRLNSARSGFRRLALPTAHALVVPSRTLEAIARDVWKQPVSRVKRIANGIAVGDYGRPTLAIPGLKKGKGEVVIGTLAGLRPVKNLARLVRCAAAIPNARIVIVGEGEDRAVISAEAERLGIADRVVLAGHMQNPAKFIGHFDIFALSSDSEQFPISLVEAMAAGLPAVCTDVGDVRSIVAEANRSFIVAPRNERGFHDALKTLVDDAALRHDVGAANRAKARAEYDEAAMIEAYRSLYEGALGES